MKFTIESGWGVVEQASGCDDHRVELDFTEEDVAGCVYFKSEGAGADYSESSSEAILILKDGRFVKASESSDSSGHG